MLLMMHNMAATALSTPEFMLVPDEANMLGLAAAGVARHYKWTGVAEKTKDWLMFIGTLSIVYPPRLRAVRDRKRGARASPVNAEAAE